MTKVLSANHVPPTSSRATRLVVALALTLPLAGVTLGVAGVAGAAKNRVVVRVANSSFAKVLFTTTGKALYTYDKDTKDHSNCNGSCLAAWPAFTIAKGLNPTGKGVRGLGVFVRANGERQVTWKGKPLYRFVSDTKGKVTGNGVAGFAVARLGAKAPKTTATTTGGYSY